MEAPARTSSREAGRRKRHDRILDAAEQLFAAQGFSKTAVDEIAAAAGVSKGLVYDHYDSKEALLAAVWWRLVEAWREATLRGAKPSASVAESIGGVLAASVNHVRVHPLLRRILAQDLGVLLPHERENALAFVRQYREQLEPVLAHGVRSGELRPDLDVVHTAELIWLVHHGLICQLFLGPEQSWRADGDALVRSAVELVLHGIRR